MQVNKAARKSRSSELFKSGQTQKVKMKQERLLFFLCVFSFLTFLTLMVKKQDLSWVLLSSEFVTYH